MTTINHTTGWFEIVKIQTYNLDEVTGVNDEYIYKSSSRVRQLLKKTWLSRYLHPQKAVFDNGSEFKRDFTPLIKDYDITPILTKIKNPQANAPVERVHQVILNMLVPKNIDNKIFNHIDTWG